MLACVEKYICDDTDKGCQTIQSNCVNNCQEKNHD